MIRRHDIKANGCHHCFGSGARWMLLTILLLLAAVVDVARSEEVVLFITGLAGWGEDEMFGVP